MSIKALSVYLHDQLVGSLLQQHATGGDTVNRFVASEAYATDREASVLSLSYLAADAAQQAAFWHATGARALNGSFSRNAKRGWLLPAFFQNLLPEGALRSHIAELRGCAPEDHFELLAAAGADLPGAVQVRPMECPDLDGLALTELAKPLPNVSALAGVQAKVPAQKASEQFWSMVQAPSLNRPHHVIAKLPVALQPHLPEVEHLSLNLARAAGVDVVGAELAPLSALQATHGFDLHGTGPDTKFLAVSRYDRGPAGRVHCEDFAQILGVQPEDKYTCDYLTVAAVMVAVPSLGEPAVHELLRRILVNDLMGNPDMHLKNIGLWYPDGRTPELPPAYDLVAYGAYSLAPRGRALHLMPSRAGEPVKKDPRARLTPTVVRDFCAQLGLPEKPAWTALRRCAEQAFDTWPALIQASELPRQMRERLLNRLGEFNPKKHTATV